MAARQWTIVFVPHGAGDSRAMRVSWRGFKILAGAVAVLGLTAGVFAYATISRAIDLSHLGRLERRNVLLQAEVDRAQRFLTALGDTIAMIAERDELVRLLAGLNPTDPAVQLAGVGGPEPAWSLDDQFLWAAPEGRRALDLRAELDNYIRRANLLARSFDEAVQSLERHTDELERTPSISPISPDVAWYTSGFSSQRLHPIYHEMRPHEGIDVSAPEGTPILAPATGRVVNVRRIAGYGLTLMIEHRAGVQTFYAHCRRILVRPGQLVRRNQKIAEVGNTGIATGPHLHYEVLLNGKPVDPRDFILKGPIVD